MPRLREGLTLHLSDIEHLEEARTDSVMPPGFGIYLFFDDSVGLEASVGGFPLPVGRHRLSDERPLGFTLCRREPAAFVRRATPGTRVRHVIISLSLEWLDQTFGHHNVALPRASQEHLAISRWFPSRRLAQTALELLDPDSEGNAAIARLRDETVALEAVTEMLATVRPPAARGEGQRTDMLLLNRARDLIEDRLGAEFSFQELASEAGVGIATLRRLFRDAYGCTIYEYVRIRRLEMARLLLEDGKPVATAAALAGYTSSANFATAFRRRFGITPSRARESVW
ncbi:helix-turn-helix transcriptional regulator [Enterovirga rhinocerotis]|uniref:AraC family transcriptional regulator n=1 Tax=Enterovirga rhinocerotis TaxID=1339210 RepID=A0A4R7C7J9_9HYPH|nr:AraC family transcriptional regulator [Enterovirga rhinocerotis]TDR94133.1 AraC family transcriptional regulator [Enterovirga rhinocerotis]